MVVEVVGTRVLAPVFGTGLYVWGALLSGTLCSLAVGYYCGGAFADRRPLPRSLGQILLGSGLALGLAVWIAPAVLTWGMTLGPRLGTLLCALLLFTPTLTGLGMVGPTAIRLISTDIQQTGHRVGLIYAISTAGSLIGTLVVVFVIVPLVETRSILLATAIALSLTSLPWLPSKSGRSAAVLITLIEFSTLAGGQRKQLPEHLTVLERAHSPYGLLEVIDNTALDMRFLRADHSVIGGRFDDGTGLFSYLHVVEALRYLRPNAKTMLQIGLGTGALSRAMEKRGISSDVVELDPEVARLAAKYFDYAPSGRVIVDDARSFLHQQRGDYDLVVHDTFTGGGTPVHLLSLEVFRQIKSMLKPDGVLLVNFVGFANSDRSDATDAVARTLQEVFGEVRLFRDAEARSSGLANLLYFASDQPLDFSLLVNVAYENQRCAETLGRFTRWEVPIPQKSQLAALITDAHNPMSTMQAPIAEAHYAAMAKLLPAAVWLPW